MPETVKVPAAHDTIVRDAPRSHPDTTCGPAFLYITLSILLKHSLTSESETVVVIRLNGDTMITNTRGMVQWAWPGGACVRMRV